MTLETFDWYIDRLEVARWESRDAGARSCFTNCPVHGGSDSLHVSEKNGKALVHCFACEAGVTQVTDALRDAETQVMEPDAPEDDPAPVTITKRGGARKTAKSADSGAQTARGVRPSPASTTQSPLDWMAERCGLTRARLDELRLPLSESGKYLVFEFANAAKVRGVGEGKSGKDFRWTGQNTPPLWPEPRSPGAEIVVCEGEADAVCLRASDIEAYSVTKGSSGSLPAAVWDALRAAGVRTVRLLFDADDAGRKGREIAAAGAREAGLEVLESRVAGIDVIAGEKDARDVALRQGYPLAVEDDADEDLPVLLSDIDPVEPEPPLMGRLHPQEHTILYGDGGSGKGVVAAFWVARLTRLGFRVLVVDYEMHANFEWRPRVERFGGMMDRVAILQPTRPIWDIAAWLRTQAASYDYVVVDSVTYACVGEEVEKSVTATKYTMAVNVLGKPVLSIAHVTKEDADPNHPFGSIFWSNGARVTIALSRTDKTDPEAPRMLRGVKTNQHHPGKPAHLPWDWLPNPKIGCDRVNCQHNPVVQLGEPGGKYPHLDERPAFKSASSWAQDFYTNNGRAPTEDEAEESGWQMKDNAIRQAVHRVRTVTVTRRATSGHDDA